MKLDDIDNKNLNYDYVVPINREAWEFINNEGLYLLEKECFLEKLLPNVISDSALIASAKSLVDYYKKNKDYPKILFFGVASGDYDISLVVEHLVRQIQELLPNESRERITIDILKNSNYYMSYFFYKDKECREIAYFYKSEDYLKRKAKFNLKSRVNYMDRCLDIMEYNALECNITPYIYNEIIDANAIKIDSTKYKNVITYNYISSHNKIDFLKQNNNIKAIYATSMLSTCSANNKISGPKYVVNATVIMPNITDKETRLLFSNMKNIGLRKEYDNSFFSMLDELYLVKEKKLFNEWISFILSQALINEFNDEYNIRQKLNLNKINEMERYFKYGNYDVRKYILKCITDPIFTGKDDLDYYLFHCLDANRNVTKFDNYALRSKSIIDDIDNYLYNKIFEKYDMVDYKTGIYDDDYILNPDSCSKVIKNLLGNMNEEDIKTGISHILSLCRLNIIDICNQTPTYYEDVVGYVQCIKTSFLAIYLYNIKYFEVGSIINCITSMRECMPHDYISLNFDYVDYRKYKAINYALLSGKLPKKLIDDISVFHAQCTRLGTEVAVFPALDSFSTISISNDPNIALSDKEVLSKNKENVKKIVEELRSTYKTLYDTSEYRKEVWDYQKKFRYEKEDIQVKKLVKH